MDSYFVFDSETSFGWDMLTPLSDDIWYGDENTLLVLKMARH